MKPTILVTGGAGYIGSQVNRMLRQQGYQTVIFDNLSTGNSQAIDAGTLVHGDLLDTNALDNLFRSHSFDGVMHFAALISVGESCAQPDIYYRNNVIGTLHLLQAMIRHKVNNIIFSSSAAIFGNPTTPCIDEDHQKSPINPYGRTKLIIEQILEDYDKAFGLRSCSLRYFNAAGGDPHERAKNYNTLSTNLIPLILNTLKTDTPVRIFGTDYDTPDGTCIRDYIHIADLGSAHILALESLLDGAPSAQYNLGNGNGYSVREVIRSTENVTGSSLPVIESPRRAGDPPLLIANSSKARQNLNWAPLFPTLESIIYHQWKAML